MKKRSLFNTIYSRVSVRRFHPDSIDEDVMAQILEAARWAPSGGNSQPWTFGMVTDHAKKTALAQAARGQMWIADAPVVVACCAHLAPAVEGSRLDERIKEVNALRWGKAVNDWLWNAPDPMHRELILMNSAPLIPGTYIVLAAAAYGIGSCWIGDLSVDEVSAILELPEDCRCFFLIPLGYPAGPLAGEAGANNRKRRPRKPLPEITFGNSWGEEWEPARSRRPFGEIIIRPYKPEDEGEWLDTWARAAVTSDAWVELIHKKPRYEMESIELVAEVNGEIAGLIDVEIEDEPGQLGYRQDSRCSFAWEFLVRPDYQGQGIARALIDAARERLTEADVGRMEFWSMDVKAQAFYEHLGMEEMERHWQFWVRLPKEILGKLREDRLGIAFTYGNAKADAFEEVKTNFSVREDPGHEPKLCIGYDYRWNQLIRLIQKAGKYYPNV